MTWNEIIGPVLISQKIAELRTFIKSERINKKIYPEGKQLFRAFDLCSYENTKVVILGDGPYPSEHADGLAFSSKLKEKPKELMNIFKEIYTDLNVQYFQNITLDEFFPSNDLSSWCKEGILLLNTVLTVEDGKPGSHNGKGWELVTDAVFDALNKKDYQVLFLLWGDNAKSYKDKITNPKHLCIEAPHPSDDSFIGCRHFSVVRDILATLHKSDINTYVNLDSCFDKELAKKIIRENFPIEAEKMCNFVDKELILQYAVNREEYYKELRRFEKSLSTKY
jgi:uracil-DNA glycosylase